MPNPRGFMCTISQEELDKFKTLFFNRYGEHLTDDVARDRFMRLLKFFSVVGKPLQNAQLPPIDSLYESVKMRKNV